MADAVSGVAGKAAMSMFGPHPSIVIVTFWQGIAEIALRGVAMVNAFICIIAAAVALDDLDSSDFEVLDRFGDFNWRSTGRLANSACGFLIFIALLVLIIEGIIVAQRFLNLGIIEKFHQIFLIVDIVISGVFAFLFFCLAISTAVYGGMFGNWESTMEEQNTDGALGPAADLNEDMGGVAFFCFVGLFIFAGLVTFMVIAFMLKWRNTKIKYVESSGALGGGD